jgi:hypothetical protein
MTFFAVVAFSVVVAVAVVLFLAGWGEAGGAASI